MRDNLMIKILQNIEYNLALESNQSVAAGAIDEQKQEVAKQFYERYYMYKKEIQQLQEEYAKNHYT